MSKKNFEVQGLESVNTEVMENVNGNVPQYDNIEWLKTTTPFFPEELTSMKCKIDREPKVQEGLERIFEMDKNGSELFMLLAKWWENKAARKSIKQMLDDEAVAHGLDPVSYMQHTLRNFANKYQGLTDAVDRMLYVTTYYKPRGAAKDTFKLYLIDGVAYNVNLRVLSELKQKITDKRALLDEIKKVSTPADNLEEL